MIVRTPIKKDLQNGRRASRKKSGKATAQQLAEPSSNGKKDVAVTARTAERWKQPAISANGSEADRQLIDRCLSGDRAAWERLYDQFHAPLLLAIRIFLGRSAARHDLVDDIAAKVWFTVIDRQSQMLDRFDSERGCRLSTFLASIAKNEVLQYFRTERRRSARETQACRGRDGAANDSRWNSITGVNAAVAEFLATLTPREREYCEGHLLALRDLPSPCYSDENRWQLSHRVRAKLALFLKTD